MHLLELPLELFHEILCWAILARGIKRGVRLRLVSKTFASEVMTTIYQFKLLDSFFEPPPDDTDDPPPSIAIPYFERRILNERPGGLPVLLRIRSVANRLSQETEDDRDEYDYIKELCPLAVGQLDRYMGSLLAAKLWRSEYEAISDEESFELDVYIAALYTRTHSVVARGLPGEKIYRKDSHLFGSIREHAARYGSHDILAAMMKIDHEGEFYYNRAWILENVAKFGRLESIQFVWNFQAAERPWAFWKRGKGYARTNYSILCELATPTKEVFDFIMEKRWWFCVGRRFDAKYYTYELAKSARKGWVDATACYLELGGCVDGIPNDWRQKYGWTSSPLLGACRNGHFEIAKLLLDHGAHAREPALLFAIRYRNFDIAFLLLDHGAEIGGALAEAVSKGYRSIVTAILQRGGIVKEELQDMLGRAIAAEDKAIFQILREYTELDEATRLKCENLAKENGLDSMLEFLEMS